MAEDSAMHTRHLPFASAFALTAVVVVGCGATTSQRTTTSPQPTPTTTQTTTTPQTTGPVEVNNATSGTLPVGQELDVRLQAALSSETATVEQRFEATTAVDLTQNGRVLVPAGSVVRGVVSDVKRPGRVERVGSLTLSFDQMVVNGRTIPIRGMATQVFESGGIREEVGTAGAGGAVGGVIGGLIGGVKGAILGAVIGAGGAIAATEGKDVHLPAGSIIRVRLDSPANVR
jgi:hypothetical protein